MRDKSRMYLLSVASLFYTIGVGTCLAALPLVVSSVGGGGLEVSAVIGIWAMVNLVSSLPAGMLSDKIGPRRSASISLALRLPLGILFYAGGSIIIYLIGRAIDGVLEALIWTGFTGSMAKAYPSRRLPALGMILGVQLLGLSIGPAISSFLTNLYGPRAPFLVFSTVSMISAALAYISLKGLPSTGGGKIFAATLLNEVKNPLTMNYILLFIMIGVYESSLTSFSPELVTGMGLEIVLAGFLLSLYYISNLMGQFSLRFVHKLVENRIFPLAAYAITSATFMASRMTKSGIPFMGFIAFSGIFNGLTFSRNQSRLCGRFKELESTAMGLGNMGWAIGYTFGASIYAAALNDLMDVSGWMGFLIMVMLIIAISLSLIERK